MLIPLLYRELSGQEITSLDTLKQVIENLHNRGTPNVIVTSVSLSGPDVEKIGAKIDGGMILVGSTRSSKSANAAPWCIQFPELEDYFVGVGDLFSALMLGNFQPDEQSADDQLAREPRGPASTPLSRAAERAVAGVQSVLLKTLETTHSDPDAALPADLDLMDEAQQRVEKVRRRELRLIQSRHAIERPEVKFHAKWLP